MSMVAMWLLIVCGAALVMIGGFFVFVRPPLLPEDARFMGSTGPAILAAAPGLNRWLRRVFWVFGGYVASTGLLVVFVASGGLRSAGTIAVLAVAGATSVGWMSAVNFMLRSDFRWALLALSVVWALGLVLAVASR